MAPVKRITPSAEAASKHGGPLTLPDGAVLESGESCMFLHPEKRDWVKGCFEGADEDNKHGRIRYKDQVYLISYYAIRDLKEVDNNDKGNGGLL